MARTTLKDLPAAAREALYDLTGGFKRFIPASAGDHAEIVGELRATQGRAFIKGVRLIPEQRAGGAEAWSLQNEASVLPSVRPYAPELLWQFDAGGWRFVGFEVIDGRHADYSLGSPDLELVVEAVAGLSQLPCPSSIRLLVEERYKRIDERAELLAGPAIVHTDLNPENVLIDTAGRVRFVDWAFVSRGASWLDFAYMVPWMIKDGWQPTQAETWLDGFPFWKSVDPEHVELFVSLLYRAWLPRAAVSGKDSWISRYFAHVGEWYHNREPAL